MTRDQVMATLKSKGKEKTAATYRRHGAPGEVFGVSWADLYALQKELGTDHALARGLWTTGNADARTLALLVADPSKLGLEEAERWLQESPWHVHTDALAKVIGRGARAMDALRIWTAASSDPRLATGYTLLAGLLVEDAGPDDGRCASFLDDIERRIHKAPNRARHAMNMALISIGIHRPALRERALEVARAIGVVKVDHGETGCVTPDAADYIVKATTRAPAKKKAKAPGKKAPAKKKGAKSTTKKKATVRTPRT
jgi:3-methyladenine DNA glycosylase AlkD